MSGPSPDLHEPDRPGSDGRLVRPTNPFIEFRKDEIEQSVVDRFEQQVRVHPRRIAVRVGARTLTYDGLNRAANRVAHAILALRGNTPEPVALALEHGLAMVAGLLGVLKAGKFYVPLDPSYPQARVASMLEDSQAWLVLASRGLRPLVDPLVPSVSAILDLDELESGLSDENPGLAIPPDAFTYILYTSGSTGQPKGVVENHRNVLHFTMVRTNSCHFSAEDRLSLLQSFSFSGSATPLFGALLNGAALFPRDVKATGPLGLAEWLIAEEITVCFTIASQFRQLVGTLTGNEEFPKLRLIRIGGEPVYARDVELYRRHFSAKCILLNSLGSSEMKSFCEYFMDKQTRITGEHVPVGYPVEDTHVLHVTVQPFAETVVERQ